MTPAQKSSDDFLARMAGFEAGALSQACMRHTDLAYMAGFQFGRACRTHAITKFGGPTPPLPPGAEAPVVQAPAPQTVPPVAPAGQVVRRRRVQRVEP